MTYRQSLQHPGPDQGQEEVRVAWQQLLQFVTSPTQGSQAWQSWRNLESSIHQLRLMRRARTELVLRSKWAAESDEELLTSMIADSLRLGEHETPQQRPEDSAVGMPEVQSQISGSIAVCTSSNAAMQSTPLEDLHTQDVFNLEPRGEFPPYSSQDSWSSEEPPQDDILGWEKLMSGAKTSAASMPKGSLPPPGTYCWNLSCPQVIKSEAFQAEYRRWKNDLLGPPPTCPHGKRDPLWRPVTGEDIKWLNKSGDQQEQLWRTFSYWGTPDHCHDDPAAPTDPSGTWTDLSCAWNRLQISDAWWAHNKKNRDFRKPSRNDDCELEAAAGPDQMIDHAESKKVKVKVKVEAVESDQGPVRGDYQNERSVVGPDQTIDQKTTPRIKEEPVESDDESDVSEEPMDSDEESRIKKEPVESDKELVRGGHRDEQGAAGSESDCPKINQVATGPSKNDGQDGDYSDCDSDVSAKFEIFYCMKRPKLRGRVKATSYRCEPVVTKPAQAENWVEIEKSDCNSIISGAFELEIESESERWSQVSVSSELESADPEDGRDSSVDLSDYEEPESVESLSSPERS